MDTANTKPSRKLESPAKVRRDPLLSFLLSIHPWEPVCESGSSTGGFGVRMSGKTGAIRGR